MMDAMTRFTDTVQSSSIDGQNDTGDDSASLQPFFTSVCENLNNLGAIAIDVFLESSQMCLMELDFPQSYYMTMRDLSITHPREYVPVGDASKLRAQTSKRSTSLSSLSGSSTTPTTSSLDMRQVADLYDVCSQTFDVFEALKFEFLEDGYPSSECGVVFCLVFCLFAHASGVCSVCVWKKQTPSSIQAPFFGLFR